MVEIALCLAIIGFALVAIIGVLPTGLNVQKNNRQETIVDQDAVVWMNALRSGARGYDDLTNYVLAITNYVVHYTRVPGSIPPQFEQDPRGTGLTGPRVKGVEVNAFTRTAWYRQGILQNGPAQFLLTNGFHIVGVISRPRIEWDFNAAPNTAYYSNYVVVVTRAMSGASVDKYPQPDQTVLDSAFTYRLLCDIEAYVPYDTNTVQAPLWGPLDPSLSDVSSAALNANPDYWRQVSENRSVIAAAFTNSHDLRLMFRWPMLPNGDVGNGRQSFRLFVSGRLSVTNTDNNFYESGVLHIPLYFLDPANFAQIQ